MLMVELPCLPLPSGLCLVSTDRALVQISVAGGPEPLKTALPDLSRLLAGIGGMGYGIMDSLPNLRQSAALKGFFSQSEKI